jgi:hypothetical protein
MTPLFRRLASKLAPAAALLLLSGAADAGIGPAEMYARARRAKSARAPRAADPQKTIQIQKQKQKPPQKPWSDTSPETAEHVRRGGPFVTFVVVPLCSNEQIDCGSSVAGRPGDLSKNIYWGAVFGQRRFFERKKSGWTLIDVTRPAPGSADPLLERAVFKREIPLAAWSTNPTEIAAAGSTAEQIVVFQAVHGASIDRALSLFWTLATEGGRVRFRDGDRDRDEPIQIAGYAGHNRLMDPGINLPPPPPIERGRPIPSFVIACSSEPYFGAALRNAGSDTLVMTRNLMAPEGYVLDAITKALGENAPREDVRRRAVDAYAKWQSISTAAASSIFAPSLGPIRSN